MRKLRISGSVIEDSLRPHVVSGFDQELAVIEGLPEDAALVGGVFDFNDRSVVLYFISAEWPGTYEDGVVDIVLQTSLKPH